MVMGFEIRAWTEADLAATVAIRNMPGVRRGTLSTPYESVERRRDAQGAPPGPRMAHLVACADGVVVGSAILIPSQVARRAHAAVIGISVHDEFQGRGVGTALFAALTDLADNWLALKRLELSVFTGNEAAIALYRKFGFEIESTERWDAFTEGLFTDAYLMARLRGDLPADVSPPPPPAAPAPVGAFALRAAEPDDLGAVTALMNQPIVRHNTLCVPFRTPEQTRGLVAPRDAGTRSILAVSGGGVVGIVVLEVRKHRQAHIGELNLLAVHEAWQGRGVGRALLGAVLDLADNWLNLRRVGLNVLADNQRAVAVYEAAGFAVEGRKRADVFRNGGYVDAFSMGRLRRPE
jgi:putative acetyltransferase